MRPYRLAAIASVIALAGQASAQTAPVQFHVDAVNTDSGFVANNAGPGHQVVYSTTLTRPGAAWLRLYFRDVVLSGNMFNPDASFVRITSMLDGAVQTLNAREMKDWHNSTAYFNGDTVVVEILASNTGVNRLAIETIDVGQPQIAPTIESLCGADDRQLSTDPRNARLLPIGCTVWLIDDAAHCFLTAGHCISAGNTTAVAQFNVPLSTSSGSTVNPPPQDQYPVNTASIQSNNGGGIGNDYAYVGFNDSAGMSAFERQGNVSYNITTNMPANGTPIRITGYGVTSSPVSPTWSQAQKTHVGPKVASTTGSPNPISYQTDTTGGNSGSPVVDDATGEAIGIHTHAGCSATDGNNGTHLAHTGAQTFLNNPIGNCVPPGLTFTFPTGLPSLIDPAGGDIIDVVVDVAGGNTPAPGTGMFHYDAGAGFVSVPMTQTSPNTYQATTPAVDCGQVMDYFFSADSTAGSMYVFPLNAPTNTLSVLAANGLSTNTVLSADFESGMPSGWSATGLWAVGATCPAAGSPCDGPNYAYYSQANCTFNTGAANSGTLTAPSVFVPANGVLEFCYTLRTENNPAWDVFTVLVNGNTVEQLTDTSTWTAHSIDLSNFSGQNVTVSFNFDTIDSVQNDHEGPQIDGVRVVASTADCNTCYADCDDNGVLNVFDYICFGSAYAANDPYADCDGNTTFNVFDYICFGNAYAAGCP